MPNLKGARAKAPPAIEAHRSALLPQWKHLWSLLAIVTVLLGGCRGKEEDTSWRQIQEQGFIRIGMEANWIPFEYIDGTGHLSGFDVELAQELGRRLGLAVQFTPNLSFDGLYDALTAGRVDAVISGVVVDTAYMADFVYSSPYFDAGQVLIVGSPQIESIETMADLRNRVLAVELGSEGDSVARRWKRRLIGLALLHTESAEATLRAVAEGHADAGLADRASALMALKSQAGQDQNGDLTISGPPVTDEQYAIVLRRESTALLRALDQSLEDMLRDGSLEHLERRWLGP
jgi:ABC-type amino acid transport substrate-binding protein